MSEDGEFIIMYHGGVMPERGLENLIEVLTLNPPIKLFVLGDGQEAYIRRLEQLAIKKRVKDRIVFHKSVPHKELWKYVGAADISMVTVRAAWKSYYYMLPNKFFESIQAETPVVCSNFPSIGALVKKYKVGLVCNPDNPKDINCSIERIRTNRDLHKRLKEHVRRAKEELCWEKERTILEEAYRRIL